MLEYNPGLTIVLFIPSFSHSSAMSSASTNIIKCSRCHRSGHYAKDCTLPFTRTLTVAEMRLKRQAEAAQKTTERKAKQAESEEKKAEWEARQAVLAKAREARQVKSDARRASQRSLRGAKSTPEWDTKSDISDATVSTTVSTVFSNEDVRCLASKDKEVRKLEKLLREIDKLQEQQDLDVLQKAKVTR